jgi:hypothetical protein
VTSCEVVEVQGTERVDDHVRGAIVRSSHPKPESPAEAVKDPPGSPPRKITKNPD